MLDEDEDEEAVEALDAGLWLADAALADVAAAAVAAAAGALVVAEGAVAGPAPVDPAAAAEDAEDDEAAEEAAAAAGAAAVAAAVAAATAAATEGAAAAAEAADEAPACPMLKPLAAETVAVCPAETLPWAGPSALLTPTLPRDTATAETLAVVCTANIVPLTTAAR